MCCAIRRDVVYVQSLVLCAVWMSTFCALDALLAGTFCAFSSYTSASTVHACTKLSASACRGSWHLFCTQQTPFAWHSGSQFVMLRCTRLSAQGLLGWPEERCASVVVLIAQLHSPSSHCCWAICFGALVINIDVCWITGSSNFGLAWLRRYPFVLC